MLNIDKLTRMYKLINLTAICEEAGLNKSTIASKVRHKRELSVAESEVLSKAINKIHEIMDEE